MKKNTHPKIYYVKLLCSCNKEYYVMSTLKKKKLYIDICSNCHPYYTGSQKIIDITGRVEKFNKKFGFFL